MIKKYSKLISINLLVFLFLFIIGFTILEFLSSINKSEIRNKGLVLMNL